MSENRARMHRALAERGFVLTPPAPGEFDVMAPVPIGATAPRGPMAPAARPAPFLPPLPRPAAPPPPGNEDDADWTIADSFTPRGLAAAAGEGGRFFGDLLAPVGEAVSDFGRNVAGGVRQFGENLAARDQAEREIRDQAEREIRDRYMPQIREANAGTQAHLDAWDVLDRVEIANADDAESRMLDLRSQLDARMAEPAPIGRATAIPPQKRPHEMDDRELLAALKSRRAMR